MSSKISTLIILAKIAKLSFAGSASRAEVVRVACKIKKTAEMLGKFPKWAGGQNAGGKFPRNYLLLKNQCL